MFSGLETLLKAADYLEQQEKLSPQSTALSNSINDHHHHHQQQRYLHQQQQQNVTGGNGSGRNLNGTRHINHSVSSSSSSANNPPTVGGATFHQVNGLTITSGSNSNSSNSSSISSSNGSNSCSSSSQLGTITATTGATTITNHNNDYEFSNASGNVVAIQNAIAAAAASSTTTSPTTITATTNGSRSNGSAGNGEDAFSSNVVNSASSPKSKFDSNSASIVILPTKTTAQNVAEQTQQQATFATKTQVPSLHKQQQQQPTQQQQNNNKTKSTTPTTTFTLIDNNKTLSPPCVAGVASAAANKQMLLNGGVRIASPAATIGQSSTQFSAAKVVNISPTHQQQSQHAQALLPTSYPLYTATTVGNTSSSSSSVHAMVTMQRHKKFTPLTPPPMPSRKFIETNTRIRSFSLSSHKFTAAAAAASAGSPQQQQLLLQNGSEDSHMSYVSGGSSGTSPPRLVNGGGSHYLQMMSSSGIAGSQAGAQPTSLIGGSGRRRTISSNSNGAGTREVHNKLEKNRRAHLKDCYEKLKYQLALPDEDRKKTSNLAILQEALKTVVALKRQERDLEAQVEQQAKEKINAQKKIVSLKRELGPKFEQYFAGIMPDVELGSIPVERENLNDTGSLSSGRGSLLYSSSSSLSSGGSSNNTVSSPVGAGLQTTMPTALSPVISQQKITTNNSTPCVTTSSSALTAPISPTMLQQLKSSSSLVASTMSNNTTTVGGLIGVVAGGSIGISPIGSPTTTATTINGIVNVTMPLSLTAKNISATSLTRGSPTPSTPSPSPSSSSGVSSSSSIISSSPPMNGVINGRNVTVNIPNGLKFQTTTAPPMGGGNALVAGTTIGALSNGSTTGATIITTAPAGSATAVVNSNNNAKPTVVATNAEIGSTYINTFNNSPPQQQQISSIYGRKKIWPNTVSTINCKLQEDEPPAKLIKFYDSSSQEGVAALQLSQVVGVGGNLVVSSSYPSTGDNFFHGIADCPPQIQALLINASDLSGDLLRLPDGAELNVFPNLNFVTCCASTTSTITTEGTNSITQIKDETVNCSNIADRVEQTKAASTAILPTTSGKLRQVNGESNIQQEIGDSNGILLKGNRTQHRTDTAVTFALSSNGNLVHLTPNTTETLHFGTSNNGSLMPVVVASPLQTSGSNNFAQQLMTAATANVDSHHGVTPSEQQNIKVKLVTIDKLNQ